MKRLFVRPHARGQGLGHGLATHGIDSARRIGYQRVILDTLDSMRGASRLYDSLGFTRIPPYYRNPLPGVSYLALALGADTCVVTRVTIYARSNRMIEVIGIDHVYLTVSNLDVSKRFYDTVLTDTLGFRTNSFLINGDTHVQYYNRHFGLVLRPARSAAPHDAYAPGLHHLCLRVDSEADVYAAVAALTTRGIDATPARRYPEYAPDYTATFFIDPDGLRLEITNYRLERRRAS